VYWREMKCVENIRKAEGKRLLVEKEVDGVIIENCFL
jgi:hypothetical protein